jgi:nicotinate-nucleotide adenylyltransferase
LRIGLLGGTFDPVHLGHLRIAEEIGEDLMLDKVYLVPGGNPPHKKNHSVSSFKDRLTMAQLAIEGTERFDVLDLEGQRQGLSYSIETLRELHQRFDSGTEIYFLIGTDAFLDIKTWKEYKNLFNYAHFVIFRRPGFPTQDLDIFLNSLGIELTKSDRVNHYEVTSGKTIIMQEVSSLYISSTAIRRMVGERRSIRFLVPNSVRDYILKRGLYSSNGDA